MIFCAERYQETIYKLNHKFYIDKIVFVFLATVCFFSFQYTFDLSHTVSCSYALLYGHISDFYEYCMEHYAEINYMPTTYLIFAVWNVPLRIFGVNVDTAANRPDLPLKLIYWNKLLLVLFYAATAFYLYKICREISWDKEKAKLCAFIWMIMPFNFYVQFCLGLYDIITVFFMVWAVYHVVRNAGTKDTICFLSGFALAATCKTIAVLYFFPFLLLKEKNIGRIIIKSIGCMSLYGFYILVFSYSDAFKKGVLGWNITELLEYSNVWLLNPFLILLIVLYACAFYNNENEKQKEHYLAYAVFYSNMVSFAFFGTCLFHPNWIILAGVFLVLALFMNTRSDAYLWMILLLSAAVYIFFSGMPGPHSEGLLTGGIWGEKGIGSLHPVFSLESLYKLSTKAYSVISAALLILAVFSHPKYWNKDKLQKDKPRGAKTICFFGIILFVIPVFLCSLPKSLVGATCFEAYADSGQEELFIVDSERSVEQRIYNEVGTWESIGIWTVTWDHKYDTSVQAYLHVIDDESGEVVYRTELDLNQFNNNSGYTDITFSDLKLKRKHWYRLRFESNAEDENQVFALSTANRSMLRVGMGYLIGDDGEVSQSTLKIRITGK